MTTAKILVDETGQFYRAGVSEEKFANVTQLIRQTIEAGLWLWLSDTAPGAGGGGGYTTIQENTTPLTQRSALNFGIGLEATDDAAEGATKVEAAYGTTGEMNADGTGTTNTAGTSNKLARIDHRHKVTITDADVPSTIARDSEVAAAYVPLSQKGAANGVVPLNASTKIDTSYLPALALTDVFVVANEAAMLALTAEEGDVAIRQDFTPNRAYILSSNSPGTLADWKDITTPGAVTSVNGQTGVVSLSAANVGAATVADISGAINTHAAAADPHTGYQKESEKDAVNGYPGLSAAGFIAPGQLGSGTRDGTKFLRDDGTWQAPSGGSAVKDLLSFWIVGSGGAVGSRFYIPYEIGATAHPAAAAVTQRRQYTMPFVLTQSKTVDLYAMRVTAAIAASSARIAVYTNKSDTNIYPDALVPNSDISMATTATGNPVQAVVPTPFTLSAGVLYHLTVIFSHGVTVNQVNLSDLYPWYGRSLADASAAGVGVGTTRGAFPGSLEATYPAAHTLINSAPVPAVGVRFSA